MNKKELKMVKEISLSFYLLGRLFKNYDKRYESFIAINIIDAAKELNGIINVNVENINRLYELDEDRYFSLIDLMGHVSLCLPEYVAKSFLLNDYEESKGFSINFMMLKDLTENILNYETFKSDDEDENIIRDIFLVFYNALKILNSFIGN